MEINEIYLFTKLKQLGNCKDNSELILGIQQLEKSLLILIDQSDFLLAGLVYSELIMTTWGRLNDLMYSFVDKSIFYLNKAIETLPIESIDSILALHQLNDHLSTEFLFNHLDSKVHRNNQLIIREELAQRLVKLSVRESQSKHLVNGLQITYKLNCTKKYNFTSFKVSASSKLYSNNSIVFNIPSAFQILLSISDYKGCLDIAQNNEELFQSPMLKGWYFAVKGWTSTSNLYINFRNAAEEFSKDTYEYYNSSREKRSHWSNINSNFWAPYFESLYILSICANSDSDIIQRIHDAANKFNKTNSLDYKYPNPARYKIILESVSKCIENPFLFKVDEAIREYNFIQITTGKNSEDDEAISFLSTLQESFVNFHNNPTEQLINGGLVDVISLLSKLSSLDSFVYEGLKAALGKKAISLCQGPTSWVHRALASIRDENRLQNILLRLFQSLRPTFVQKVHGILEHGRDIIVVEDSIEGKRLLIYQVKVGDINTSSWRKVKPQLEEMMEVPPPDLIVSPNEIYIKTGILVFNGYVNPIASPKISSWIQLRSKNMQEEYQIMCIDSIVTFIINNSLASEFRIALEEFPAI